MLIPLIILSLAAVGFLFLYRAISLKRIAEVNRLQAQTENIKAKYEFMLGQKRELERKIKDQESTLMTLRNNQDGIRIVSVEDLNISGEDENEKVSRYLIQQGKITLEQNEKVLKKMNVLQMDYIGVCLTLGFIDLATAKLALKVNKVKSKTIA